MRCFNHRDVDAVGICKVCQRGLCVACAADLAHGIACKGEHEAEAEALHGLIRRNLRVQGEAHKAWYVAPAFFAFMGIVFFSYGLREAGSGMPLYLGGGFIVFSVVVFFANRRAYSASSRKAE